MDDTVDHKIIINDEPNDTTRGVQAGEPLVPGNGNRVPEIFYRTVAPTETDDSTLNISQGDLWIDTVLNQIYWCRTPAIGAAVWSEIGDAEGDRIDVGILAPRPISQFYANTETADIGLVSPVVMPLDTIAFIESNFFQFDAANNKVIITETNQRITIDADVTAFNVDKSSAALLECWIELNGVEVDGTRGEITVTKADFGGNCHLMAALSTQVNDEIRVRMQQTQGSALIRTRVNGCRLKIRVEGPVT